MRRKMIEALTYPRLFVLKEIGLQHCPHDAIFDPNWDRCRNCGLGQECHWLSCLNDFADLSNKPIHTLHASLLYSIKLIESHAEQMQHHIDSCGCESCSWTRDAQQLSREFFNQYEWDFNLKLRNKPSTTQSVS